MFIAMGALARRSRFVGVHRDWRACAPIAVCDTFALQSGANVFEKRGLSVESMADMGGFLRDEMEQNPGGVF